MWNPDWDFPKMVSAFTDTKGTRAALLGHDETAFSVTCYQTTDKPVSFSQIATTWGELTQHKLLFFNHFLITRRRSESNHIVDFPLSCFFFFFLFTPFNWIGKCGACTELLLYVESDLRKHAQVASQLAALPKSIKTIWFRTISVRPGCLHALGKYRFSHTNMLSQTNKIAPVCVFSLASSCVLLTSAP